MDNVRFVVIIVVFGFIVLAFRASHRGRSHLAVHFFGSENFAWRWKNDHSFRRAAQTNTRTCEHNRKSAAIGDGLAEACQRSVSSYDDGAADGTTGLAGHKVRALVRGEAPFSHSEPARSANNGPGLNMAK